MKLIGYTLLDIDDYLQQENTNRIVTLFKRVHIAMRLMIDQLALLETMSPKEYQEIRLQLGNGSGQESPGFRTILKMHPHIWNSFKTNYLDKHNLTVEKIYNSEYSHSDAYVVAESMVEFDELFQRFRFVHIQLIHRTIGLGAKSLKGRSVDMLNEGQRVRFFPRAMGNSSADDGYLGRQPRLRPRFHRRTLAARRGGPAPQFEFTEGEYEIGPEKIHQRRRPGPGWIGHRERNGSEFLTGAGRRSAASEPKDRRFRLGGEQSE